MGTGNGWSHTAVVEYKPGLDINNLFKPSDFRYSSHNSFKSIGWSRYCTHLERDQKKLWGKFYSIGISAGKFRSIGHPSIDENHFWVRDHTPDVVLLFLKNTQLPRDLVEWIIIPYAKSED